MPLFGRGKTELDKNLQEALSKEQWGCAQSILQEIAISTENDGDRQIVLKALWAAIGEKDKMWRRVYKGLVLAEVILKRGSVRIIEDLKSDQFKIQKLKDHRVMEGGKDVAGGIREKANFILEMLNNPTELNNERQKNYQLYSKFQGVGTDVPDKKNRMKKLTEKAAIAAEANERQKEVDLYLGVQEFTQQTGAPENQATYYLRRNHGNVKEALKEWNIANGRGGYKPKLAELRSRCEQVQMIAEVDERRAMALLEQNGWDAERAIEAGASQPKANPQEDSDSDSDSSSSSSDDEANKGGSSGAWGNQSGMGGWPGSPSGGMSSGGWPGQQQQQQSPGFGGQGGFMQGGAMQGGAMQRSNSAGPTYGGGGGFGGQQPNNGFGGNSFGGGKGGAPFGGQQQGGFGGQQQGGFGGQQPGGFGGQQQGGFGGMQGGQKGGFGGMQGGGGFGGQQQGGFGQQKGGFGGQQPGGFGGQQQGGFGGMQGGMQGGQKGGFGGMQGGGGFGGQQQGGFGQQKGGFGGQQGGFGGQQQGGGFGGQQGGFGGQQAGFGGQQGFGQKGGGCGFGGGGGFGGKGW